MTSLMAESSGTGPTDYSHEYDELDADVLGDNASDEEPNYEDKKKKKKKKRGFGFGEEEEKEEEAAYMLFDFRRGEHKWPENVELVDREKAQSLLEKAKEAAVKAAKEKKEQEKKEGEGGSKYSGVSGGKGYGGGNAGSWSSSSQQSSGTENGDSKDSKDSDHAPKDARFEKLKDGSTALIVPAGTRLRLDLREILEGGDAKKEERRKKALKKKKKKGGQTSSWLDDPWADGVMMGPSLPYGGVGTGTDMGDEDDLYMSSYSRYFKEWVNSYTITMDIKINADGEGNGGGSIPREGISLFQTALIHTEENSKTGKKRLKQSDGECMVNSAGGVGIFGTFGDVTKASVEPGQWKRVVVSVACSQKAGKKGEMRTWVDTEPGVVLKDEGIVEEGRFALDPDSLFLFSSANAAMMPGGIAIRTVRVDANFSSDDDVKQNRARDKVISMFNEERQREINEQRKGLSLAAVFAKPRPIWDACALVGVFGDAFIENTGFEGSSCLAWSYTVLNLALQRCINQPLVSEGKTLFD